MKNLNLDNLKQARLLVVEQAVIIDRVLYWADAYEYYKSLGSGHESAMLNASNKVDECLVRLDAINAELGVLWN